METTSTENARDEPPARDESAPNDEPKRSSFLRFLPFVAAIALIVSAILSVVLQNSDYENDIPISDWRAASEHVRNSFVPGDVVRFEPVWDDDPRVFFDGFPTDMTSKPDAEVLSGYERVWILAGWGRDVPMPDTFTSLAEETFGKVTVRLYAVPPSAEPAFDFMEELTEASVRRVRADGRAPQTCAWNPSKKAFYCGRIDPWLYVKKRLLDMQNEPRWCIYLPPVPDELRHELTYEDVLVGPRIEGRVGLDSWSVRTERGSDTHFEIAIDDTVVYHQVIAPRDNTFYAYQADTSAFQGKKAKVTFRTWASDFFDRYSCFTASIPKN